MKAYFLKNPMMTLRWFFQCLLVFFIMWAFLAALGELRSNVLVTAIGTTSVGSSAFLAFVAHNSPMAHNHRLIGGYIIAITIGGLMHYLSLHYSAFLPFAPEHAVWILSAAATALTMMFMTLVNLPHAPAAGLSLAMVIKFWVWQALVILCVAVLVIAILKTVLRPWLVNLT